VSFCSVLPEKSVGSLLIGQVFEKCQNVCILASVDCVKVLVNALQTALRLSGVT
jgi:hypothetical protein